MSDGPEWARWYVGGKVDYVHNAVDKHAESASAGRTAIIWEGEEGEHRSLTYAELAREVDSFAAALRGLGVGKGDRVGLFLPLTPEAAIASLASSKLGAIYVRSSPVSAPRGRHKTPGQRSHGVGDRGWLLPARSGRADEGDR